MTFVFCRRVSRTVNDVYITPTFHAVSYFSGCITLLLLNRYTDAKVSKVMTNCLWAVAATSCLAGMFTMVDWYRGTNARGNLPKMAFGFFHKILWSLFLSITTFNCASGKGGYLGQFLSWNLLVPFSRLTLCVYLINVPVYVVLLSITRERIYYAMFNLIFDFFGVLCFTLIFSFFMFLVCEFPTARLDNLLFSLCSRNRTSETQEKEEVIKSNFDEKSSFSAHNGNISKVFCEYPNQQRWSHL